MDINLTGGARIGMANATWPFATLKVTKEKLELKGTIIGNLVFKPGDIESIEPYGFLPLIGRGIKINHRIKTYNSKVIFWTFGDPKKLIKDIENTGFFEKTNQISESTESEIVELQKKGGFPLKISASIFTVVVWNLLFLIDFIHFFKNGQKGIPLGIGVKSALFFILITSFLVLTTKTFQRLFLKEGRSIDDIKKFIYFIMIICGFMLLNISIMSAA